MYSLTVVCADYHKTSAAHCLLMLPSVSPYAQKIMETQNEQLTREADGLRASLEEVRKNSERLEGEIMHLRGSVEQCQEAERHSMRDLDAAREQVRCLY